MLIYTLGRFGECLGHFWGSLMAFDTLLARRLTLEPSTTPHPQVVAVDGQAVDGAGALRTAWEAGVARLRAGHGACVTQEGAWRLPQRTSIYPVDHTKQLAFHVLSGYRERLATEPTLVVEQRCEANNYFFTYGMGF